MLPTTKPVSPTPFYVTLDEAAVFLKMTKRSVYNRITDGTLKPRKIGGRILLKMDEVIATVEATAK
jgi:excisionase family DNA binding protein